jgi:hypothetical protein
LYFSSEPVVPESVDPDQYRRLIEFRSAMENRGLFDRYNDLDELRRKINSAVTRTLRERFALAIAASAVARQSGPLASLLAHVVREREMRGLSKQGRPQYSTRHRLLIENTGTGAANGLTFRFELPGDGGGKVPATIGNENAVAKLPPGGSLEYPLLMHMGTAQQFDIIFNWSESGAQYEDRHTLR